MFWIGSHLWVRADFFLCGARLKGMSDLTMQDTTTARTRELAKAYDPSAIEEKWASFWVKERLFDTTTADVTEGAGKAFTMLLPPPNVTGRLHMGHMLNQTEMDILTRWHRMLGETALWVPGTDHAGIATQMMVEKQLASEGVTSRKEMGREAFVERVWDWKRQYGGAITEQMRRLGASVDWSREYFTMDDDLSAAVKEAFVRLWEQGLIYRGAYIVNWDPAIQTAVSDLEVENEERIGKLYFIRYPLADGAGSIVIATTRPETMLADEAVAVNPDDDRYRHLIGKKVILPLSASQQSEAGDRQIEIIPDDWAKPEFGTGAVKVTPAHDPNDFAIGKRHNLSQRSIFDEKACIALPGSPYHGLDRFEARERIVRDLDAAGLLESVKEHPMTVPVSQRSGSVIEPRLSDQWFIQIQPLADKAIAAVKEGHIRFTPEMYEKTYFEWMGNIHDWCISRQLWWGHRIPAWYCAEKHITIARETPAVCSTCGRGELVQETDVLDTWFSSGLLPFTVFGWPGDKGGGKREEGRGEGATATADSSASPRNDKQSPLGSDEPTAEMAAFYPTDVLVTGFDILFFWVARMIMLGTHFMSDVPMPDGSVRELKEAVPFREVYIHALVRDADRQKMSKTKGNVIDPIDIIGRFGTDAVRFTLASMASPGTDIAFSEARTEGYRAFANKIWNAARFLFMNMERAGGGFELEVGRGVALGADAPLEARWIVSRLGATAKAVGEALAVYRFDEAAATVYQFFWGEFCDWYLELVKLRLNFGDPLDEPDGGNREAFAALGVFVGVFDASLRLLSPFMPFITEEIWHALWGAAAPAKSIALTRYPLGADFVRDAAAEREMELLQEVIVTVRGLRKEMGVPEKEAAPVRIYGDAASAIVADHANVLAKMARVEWVDAVPEPLSGNGSRSTGRFDLQVVYERVIDVAAERERLTKELAKFEKGLAAAQRQLGNEAFMAKAPAHIVDGLRKQAAETQMLYDRVKAGLAELAEA
jgi:valyl-tRNA synthetase